MKFTRLRVLGFKSFVEPTEFVIEPGLTGVVGPNGCGKSNLVEALRWVMGESSYKAMRASGMDDVIFQGSLNRPARNTAEVSLLVDNGDRTAPVAFNDAEQIEITRRIEREAGSIYRINGRDVRARDVQLLFADASTGAHSPAIVGQGKIGELIAAKPVDRRALLEEAAGIAGLHNRRHEAELRLKAAEQNLARVDDVIAEIEQQVDTLKRQARQATRYRNLTGEIRKAEATVLHLRWRAATSALGEAETQLADAVAGATARGEEQAVAARVQAEASAALPELRDVAARAGAALQRLKLAGETLDQEEARIKARLDELERRLAQLGEDIGREERMVADNTAILSRLAEEERGLMALDAASAERQAHAASARATAEAALRDSEAVLADLTQQHAMATAARAQHEHTIAEAEGRGARLAAELAAVTAELATLAASADVAAATTAARSLVAEASAQREARDAATATADQELVAARDAATSARSALTEADRALERIETEAATLAAVLATDGEGKTPVVDAINVDHGYETALAAAFGDDLAAPADADAPAHWREVSHGEDEATLPAGTIPLARHVRVPDVLLRRLAQTGLVSRADGPAKQAMLRPGQRLVSVEGDLWRWDGYVSTADAPRSAAQRLAQRNRLAELEASVVPARDKVAALGVQLAAAEAAVQAATEADREAREALRLTRKALDEAQTSLMATEREEGRATARRTALDAAGARIGADIAESEATVKAARGALAAVTGLDALAESMAAQRTEVDAARSSAAEARAAHEGMAREAAQRATRLSGIESERRDWQQRLANAEEQIATLRKRREEAGAERETLAGEPAKIEAKRASLLSEIVVADAKRAEAADKLAVGEKAASDADKAARSALDRHAEARELRGRSEERVTAARQRLSESEERIREALDCAPEETAAVAELDIDAPLPDLNEIEARLERHKQERERLGAVNLRADEEAREIAARRDTLVGERTDLVEAIARLRQGIGSLNREGRERLSAAFETVNAHFKRLFTHLFGGGTAELQLTDSDDPLEAGLEIVARPPGKKPQVMTLLSGGEQALTALSLIFAVFMTNPAPICVLDEVDAPLDDANVVRFCNLLEEMTRSTDTRFITITHNPITMAKMNRLFGVTMAERGVSQLVSVDLETAERFREAG
ncbi:MAG TPA: chromosome segregation protein SMC [Bauldia sp.]|nr:chromosome segregation protein SMC [Bauldia sp.]